MKKKSRLPRSSSTQTTLSVSEQKLGHRGRPRKTVPGTTDGFYRDDAPNDKTPNFNVTAADETQKRPDSKSKSSGECLSSSPTVQKNVLFLHYWLE